MKKKHIALSERNNKNNVNTTSKDKKGLIFTNSNEIVNNFNNRFINERLNPERARNIDTDKER